MGVGLSLRQDVGTMLRDVRVDWGIWAQVLSQEAAELLVVLEGYYLIGGFGTVGILVFRLCI